MPNLTPTPAGFRPTVIYNGPSAGGTGKTQNVITLAAILRLAGHEVLLVDADPTTRGLQAKLPQHVLRFASGSAEIEAECDKLLDTARDKAFVLIDAGAAALQQPMLIEALTLSLDTFTTAGFRCVLALSLVANKGGLARDITRFRRVFGPAAELFTLLTAASGTAGFAPYDDALAGLPRIPVPRLSPALVELSTYEGRPLDEVVTSPPTGLKRAAALLAQHLVQVAVQPAVTGLLGIAPPLAHLRELADDRPHHWFPNIERISGLHDRALEADAAFLHALNTLCRLDQATDDDAVLTAARMLMGAHRSRTEAASAGSLS